MTNNEFDIKNKVAMIAQKHCHEICVEMLGTDLYPCVMLDADKLYPGLRDLMIASVVVDEEGEPKKGKFNFRASVSK